MKKTLNIVLGALFAVTVAMLLWAVVSGGAEVAISWNLIWGYILVVLAIAGVVGAAIGDTVKSPAGLKKTLLAVVLVVVVVGAALGYSMSNEQIIPNSAGGVFDDPFELAISQTGIIVTYIVAVATMLTTLFVEVRNLFK